MNTGRAGDVRGDAELVGDRLEPVRMRSPRRCVTVEVELGILSTEIVAMAAAISGVALKVPASITEPPAVKFPITSALPAVATGNRCPSLPKVVRSGSRRRSLTAAERVAETGDHLVEDQHAAVLPGDLPQALEGLLGQQRAHVVRHGLEDHRGDLLGVTVEQLLDRARSLNSAMSVWSIASSGCRRIWGPTSTPARAGDHVAGDRV